MSSYGRSTGPDRRWRPSDADRERYAEAVSAAFSDGRISAEDMQSRTALVYEAATIADLEALVDDIPSASPTSPRPVPAVKRPPYGRMVLVGVLCAAAIVGAAAAMSSTPVEQHEATGGGVVEGDQDGGAAGLEPVDVDVPDIATEKPGLFTEEGLIQMWETMSAGDVSEIKSITVRPGHGMLIVRSDTEEPGLAEIR
ncbi:DUF1707 SHOCT-like domain-containing protein, partial [Phytoactinopolyspora endophytica]|uniref:DUF1707 SHOCT-like domain-containing protein n=1 Tax=Phytoactinopolyspora endophytica TaxID=1642495 RepID=UPI0013EB6B1A